MSKFHITTPIYYVNSEPHIGHLYTNVVCDFLARFYKLRNRQVMFTTGTDEYGQKVYNTAQKQKMPMLEFCDLMSGKFVKLFHRAHIQYDKFLRTTTPEHRHAVQNLWLKLQERGEIYFARYNGWYSVTEESYYTAKNVILDDKGDHRSITGSKVERVDTDSYFFRLSKWQKPLLDFYRQHPDFIQPKERYNEVLSFVKEGLQDLSISRPNVTWGIPVPDNDQHIIYVWLDALVNYLVPYGFPQSLSPLWPPTLQVLGKDILRFHAVYWPAILMAAGIEVPPRLFAHGWWIVKGDKMSKSLGNVVHPDDLLTKYGVDSTRYAMLGTFAFGQDGEYNVESMVSLLNKDLADTVGNLIQRVMVLLRRHFGVKVPRAYDLTAADQKLWTEVDQYATQYENHIENLQILAGLKGCTRLAILGNRYLQDMQPWRLVSHDIQRARTVMYVIFRLLVVLAVYLWPALPISMEKFLQSVGLNIRDLDMQKLLKMDFTGREIKELEVLFPKL